ncbi:porin [Aliiglaciecola sp. CAU 1673]|uniref:porin n=1 Tax=Aliiglaciecola sp. CAU 1673 TaxID=3032595 RepID=UPI0023DBAD4C|nr:porin [Aliiglaciecola sp. CAU 1673]MDF2176973.1 porin [Aliiglaciecola sp. CAU 1673]
MKKLVLLAVATSVSTTLYAENTALEVYGKANLSFQMADEGEGSFSELKSNASRVGVQGQYALEGNLEAFYQIEWQVDLSDISGSDNISARNQFVGLRGDLGELTLGRRDTMLKLSQGKIDQFNDYEADIKAVWKGENRLGDNVSYISPAFNNFRVGVTYLAEDEPEGDSGVSAAVFYGDEELKQGNLYASLAMDEDVAGYDIVRLSAQYKFDSLVLGAMLQEQELQDGGSEKQGWMVSGAFKHDKLTYKAQYQALEDDYTASVGADYKLGSKTKAFIFYTAQEWDSKEDKSWLAVGLEHKF